MFAASRQCRNILHLHSLRPQVPHKSRIILGKPIARRNVAKKHYFSSLPDSQAGKDRAAVGVFTPKAAALFVAVGVGLYFYFRYEKQKLLEQRERERESRTIGRAHVGGPFKLTTYHNKPFSELDLLGKWNLVYFGFTNCPDICPAELDKIGVVVDTLEKEHGQIFQPLFISVDPARDTLAQITLYLQDFHPRLIGLVGNYATTKSVCKAYRVYFSTPPNADPKGDYLVDHSIFVYLMDPRGGFVEAFGQSVKAEDIIGRIRKEVSEWEDREGKKV